jgi:peroxiredoxin
VRALAELRTQDGATPLEISQRQPILLIFLRHFGCALCREMVADVARHRRAIDAAGMRVVFVHMHTEAMAARFFERYGLADAARVSDPDHRLYEAFGLTRARPTHWLNRTVIARYLEAIFRRGHRPGYVGGDVLRMPGAFVVRNGDIVRSFRPTNLSETIDLVQFVR